MSTLPYGLEWRGRKLSKKSLLNCCGPAHRAGGAINTCLPTGGHSHAHEKEEVTEFLNSCGGCSHFKMVKLYHSQQLNITFPASTPSFLQPESEYSSFCVQDVSQQVVSLDDACIHLCPVLEVVGKGQHRHDRLFVHLFDVQHVLHCSGSVPHPREQG